MMPKPNPAYDGWLKVFAVHFLYTTSLFLLGMAIAGSAVWVSGIPITSTPGLLIGITAFTLIAILDYGLILCKKVSPVIVIWVLLASPVMSLYRFYTDTDLIKWDSKNAPVCVRTYLVHPLIF